MVGRDKRGIKGGRGGKGKRQVGREADPSTQHLLSLSFKSLPFRLA